VTVRTWQGETFVVAFILAAVALSTHARPVEWIGSLAVLAGFQHAIISQRMAEREAARERPSVECFRKAIWYWIAKEILWTSYFIAMRSWSALIGCGVFLLYPFWRKAWRMWHPLQQSEKDPS
jgi:hypothetical protein